MHQLHRVAAMKTRMLLRAATPKSWSVRTQIILKAQRAIQTRSERAADPKDMVSR